MKLPILLATAALAGVALVTPAVAQPPAGKPAPGKEAAKGKSIFERVKAIIVEQLGAEAAKVTPTSKIVADLGADSLDVVELVMAMEEEFNIELPDEEAAKIVTVADLVNTATKKVAAQKAAK